MNELQGSARRSVVSSVFTALKPRGIGRVALAIGLAMVPAVVACSSANDEIAPVAEQSEPIINGTRDSEHPAAVSLLMERPGPGDRPVYSSCTGTIIKADAATKIAYILTAAHCVRGAKTVYVSQTSNTADPPVSIIRYTFLDLTVHPQYNGATSSPYDIAMVRTLGGGPRTPVMPYTAQDGLASGTRVTSVGFGRTVRPGQDAGTGNTFKNKIDGAVRQLSTAQMGVAYDNNGDICQGDSGGPVIGLINGKEHVVGVHSFVTGPCVGVGYSVRASGHDAFIRSVLDAEVPAETCELCRKKVSAGNESCAEARRTCLNDPQCDGLRVCLSRCTAAAADAGIDGGATDDCKKACAVEFPFGAGPYNTQVLFCSCRECPAACGADAACAGLPKCGMKVLGGDACNTCLEGSCCAQESACGKDGHCYRCTRTPETPGCDTDPLYQALNACKATSCATECAPPPATPEPPPPSESGMPGGGDAPATP